MNNCPLLRQPSPQRLKKHVQRRLSGPSAAAQSGAPEVTSAEGLTFQMCSDTEPRQPVCRQRHRGNNYTSSSCNGQNEPPLNKSNIWRAQLRKPNRLLAAARSTIRQPGSPNFPEMEPNTVSRLAFHPTRVSEQEFAGVSPRHCSAQHCKLYNMRVCGVFTSRRN